MNVQKDVKLSHGVNMLKSSVLIHYNKYSTCRAKATVSNQQEMPISKGIMNMDKNMLIRRS